MNNTNITRRTLAKGVAWSAPTMLATSVIPAYAASPEDEIQYGVVDTSSSTYSKQWDGTGCTGTVTTSTDSLTPKEAGITHGFAIIYNPESVNNNNQSRLAKIATYNKIDHVVTFPKGMVDKFDIDPRYALYWTYKKESWKNIKFEDNGEIKTIDASNLDVFVFNFQGYNSALVYNPDRISSPWRHSKMKATATISNQNFCDPASRNTFVQYAGYIYDVTLDTGERIQTDTITWRNLSAD